MPTWVIEALQLLAPSGAVVWAVKYALNGTRQRIVDVHDMVKEHGKELKEVRGEVREIRDSNVNLHGRMWIIEQQRLRETAKSSQ